MEKFVELLKEKKITIATCESCTGGLLAAMLCDFSGISAVYKGSIVTYRNEIKERIVGVDPKLIADKGVVSEEVAREMAIHTQKLMNVDLCISYTGNAGPDVCDNKPVGCVYCGVAFKDEVFCFEYMLKGSRNEIRHRVIEESIKKIKEILGNMTKECI